MFSFHENSADYLINISKNTRSIYFEVPKVACSSIKLTMQKLEDRLSGSDCCSLMLNPHDKQKSPLSSPFKLNSSFDGILQDFFKFTYVRNPYARALSCYLDKIIGNQWERNIRLPALGFSKDEHVSFLSFLNSVKMQKIKDMDIHWMPQYYLLGENGIEFDFVGRFEEFNKTFPIVLSYMAKRNAIEVGFEDIFNHSFHSTGAISKLEKFYTEEEALLVRELYGCDFEAFGYSKLIDFAI